MVKVFKWYLEKGQPSKDNGCTFKLGRVEKIKIFILTFLDTTQGGYRK